jgi:hypothetical protein
LSIPSAVQAALNYKMHYPGYDSLLRSAPSYALGPKMADRRAQCHWR